MKNSFLEYLNSPKRPVLVFDGAMGTSLQTQNLTASDFGGAEYEGCNEYLVHTKPESVEKVHRQFLEAGADVIETDTFGGTSLTLVEYDLADQAYYLNKAAAALAKKVAQEFSTPDKPRFVAGSMGPGTKLPTLGHVDFDTLKNAYIEQVEGLYDGGVDLFLVETCQDVLQIKAALNAILEVQKGKPERRAIMVSVTMEDFGTMLVGTEAAAALAILEPYPIDILGLNCATGPDLMKPHIKYLAENSPFIISCIPNAGLPENVGGQAHYRLTPLELQMSLMHFIEDLGVQVIGGCCGTRPDHIAALVGMSKDLHPKERKTHYEPSASSIFSTQPYIQENSFLIIGERLNASGSKKCRDLLAAEDWDSLISLAKSQEREGAHILDVNVDYVGRDGIHDMRELASRLVNNIKLPLMLDSTEWQKMEAGLKVAGGKSILNSTNYEDGEERFYKLLELAKQYGAGIVVGTIDEEGMARTGQKKFTIAQRAYRAAVEYGIPCYEIFFDPLALPISTGIEEDRANGRETIESIKEIRAQLPGCHILLGISNISFGLKPAARQVLNSIFLHECMQAGLDSAIVSANKILPLAKIPEQQQKVCLDLIYDRRVFENDICVYDPLTELTKLFENPSEILNQESKKLDLTIEERLKNHIIDGERQGLEATLSQALEKYPPLEIINVYLLDGMKTVGELFGSGQMQLPFVLQSAQTMKAAVAHLEPFMEKNVNSNGKGTLLIATVKGDVHDIGKNLVDIILSNNGYQVINLGIKQPVENIIKAYEESNADCIAMSGLLVKSTAFMKENLEAFNEKGITVPVILGGAALNSKFVDQDCQNTYKGRVIYGKDAFTDLKFMDRLMPAKQDNRWNNLVGFLDEEQDQTTNQKNIAPITIESKFFPQVEEDEVIEPAIERNIDRPHPPFWGTRILNKNDIALSDLFPLLDIQALYVGQWQFRKTKEQSESDYKSFLQNTVEPILQTWQEKAQKEQILDPTVVYGYFPCNAEGDTLYIYDSKTLDQSNPIASFTFPRQKKGRRLCIADFFAERSSGIIDVFPMQAVTVGDVATEYAKQLFEADEYSNYLYYHGMAVQTAEALAEWTHRLIRQELGIEKDLSLSIKDLLRQRYQGSRYSFGYPACPNIQDQYRQIELLDCQRIGLYMDESEQIYPEQSTTALIVYHPSAKYFNI